MRDFQIYTTSNETSLINYGERYRSGERISSAFVEATLNAVVSKRFAKKQQMSGADAARTCSCRRGPGLWMARCVPHSSNSILA
ncbi:hypothetical protein JO965_40020 (plasmid) [Microvirga sp. VF16]|nr:hypothetical protein JO965_40020 [Microvirga sp. VF16]